MASIWEFYVKPNTLTDLVATSYNADGTIRAVCNQWRVVGDFLYNSVSGSSNGYVIFTATGYQDLRWEGQDDGEYDIEMQPLQYIKEIQNNGLVYLIKDAEARESINTLSSQIVTDLSGLSDVSISSPSQGENLTYDAATGKWKNTATSATVAWGGITGDIDDQTDLKNALSAKTTKFSTINPTLTSASGLCKWSITNSIGSKKVQVNVYEIASNNEVVVDVTATDSTISVEFISANNIAANSYEAVVIG